MIFQHTWKDVLEGRKTQTRRIVKPNHNLIRIESAYGGYRPLHLSINGHILYAIGRAYAVQPGRGKSTLWWKTLDGILCVNPAIEWKPTDTLDGYDYEDMRRFDNRATWRKHGYTEGLIRLTDIRREDVRCISDDDVTAEGFERAVDFWHVWCAMHDKAVVVDPGSEKTIVSYPRINQFTVEEHADVRAILMLRPAGKYQAWALSFELVTS